MEDLLISFDHGYENLKFDVESLDKPALWHLKDGKSTVHRFPFPRNPSDFRALGDLIVGKPPLPSAQDFEKLPRFGLTGMTTIGDHIYAGSWNGIYKIKKDTLELDAIISNNMMNDTHGIASTGDLLVSVLTSKDTVVLTDEAGKIVDYFTIMNDLSVVKNESIEDIDWRFVSKQYRGSCGFWHFNFVQVFGNEVWLTSRNASAFVVVDLTTRKAKLRLISHMAPNLIHDGKLYNDKYYFTSVDGKILITSDSEFSSVMARKEEKYLDNMNLYHRDLIIKMIRLDNPESLGREPNWCRGIGIKNESIWVTIDGSYGTDLSFGLLEIDHDGKVLNEHRLRWSEIGEESEIRYVAGFDIHVLN